MFTGSQDGSDSSALLLPSFSVAHADMPVPVSPPGAELEVVGGFRVHPAASRFPLLTGKDFEELVESIRHTGVAVAVELHDGLLIDGRNRVRAVEELRRQGVTVALPQVRWQPVGDETLEEYLYAKNVNRRHLTDDQRAALAAQFVPGIRKSREERQAATRFGNKGAAPAAQESAPPAVGSAGSPRSSREKDAASTVGQVAALAKISRHKAMQAVALADGVAAGKIPAAELQGVVAGSSRLRDAVRPIKPAGTKKSAARLPARPAAELIFDTALGAPAAELIVDVVPDEPDVTEEEVRRRWAKFKEPFAITDHRQLRTLVKKLIAEEQREFDA
jgi:hypothetical protein